MPGYFENFPLVRYANTNARNILTRVAFNADSLKERYNYYPYEIKTEMRPDLLSYFYYDNSYYDWVLMMANGIVDPYYQWYLNGEELTKFIEKKYGSLTNAVSKIHHWEVNWLGDDSNLTVAQYEALAVNPSTGVNLKKYWSPIVGDNDNVIGYKRKELNATVKYNKITELNTTFSTGNTFTVEEKVYQTSGGSIFAYGFVEFSNSSILLLKNIEGSFSNTSNLIGEESESVASFTYANTIARSFPETESSYWSSISNYDYEIAENEKRRSINVISKNNINDVQTSFENLLENE